ncbi:STAS domain-containing protein [Pseudonocardia zijingensis]|uniref:STAS domain-containing protein n=1 Tax=Pseudonocardia zijingensis TaxID=153376 RepID=UPI00361CFDB9
MLLNTEAIVELDITAADALHTLCDELDRRGVVAALARVKQDLLVYLDGSGLRARIGDDRIFPTLPTAVAGFRASRGTPTSDPRGSTTTSTVRAVSGRGASASAEPAGCGPIPPAATPRRSRRREPPAALR